MQQYPPQQPQPAVRRSTSTGSAILIVLITILLPPVGVALVAGCGADVLLNILLTLLGYFPGHIHAFYLEYTYYKRHEDAVNGIHENRRAPLIFSDRVQTGGRTYGTM